MFKISILTYDIFCRQLQRKMYLYIVALCEQLYLKSFCSRRATSTMIAIRTTNEKEFRLVYV